MASATPAASVRGKSTSALAARENEDAAVMLSGQKEYRQHCHVSGTFFRPFATALYAYRKMHATSSPSTLRTSIPPHSKPLAQQRPRRWRVAAGACRASYA